MGRLVYDNLGRADIDDRVLAHLQAVIGAKLRRRESFWFEWSNSVEEGSGRSAVWLHPEIDLRFTYSRLQQSFLNRAWVDVLMQAANSPTGLYLLPEPSDDEGGVGDHL